MRFHLTWLCLSAEQACPERDRLVCFFFFLLTYKKHTLLTLRTSCKTRRDGKTMPTVVRTKVTLVQSIASQGKATSLQCISQKPEAKERSLHCVGGARNANKHPETMWSATQKNTFKYCICTNQVQILKNGHFREAKISALV